MNIIAVNNFIPFNKANARNNSGISNPQFGLRLVSPLSCDTVSFTGARSIKVAGSQADMIRQDLAIKVRKRLKTPHEKLKSFFTDNFGDLIKDEKITLLDRIKSEYSIRLKTSSRKWADENSILSKMTDVSGFCFVLEDKKSFNEVMNRFIKFIKEGKINIAKAEEIEGLPVEYHVVPPKYKRGKIVESNDSLNPTKLQELKKAIIDTYHPASRMSDTIDSITGYSGLHVIVKNSDGTFSEVKFMTRGMVDVQKIENLFYKKRNGKSIDPKYVYLEPLLKPFEPLSEYATDAEKKEYEKLSKAISKYIMEVYKFALKHPYTKNAELPKPTDPLIEKYDFNKLRKLMEACESM